MDSQVLNTIDAAVLGERLADARRARRLTQQHVAEALGVARTTVVAIEKGERRPRPAELVTLAGLYGKTVGEVVRAESPDLRPDFLIRFRTTNSNIRVQTGGEQIEDIHRFQRLCQWYVELESILESPLPQRYPPEYQIHGAPPERAAEEIAHSERNRLGLGDGPIGDLWGMLETDLGLRVFALPMRDHRVAGMFLYADAYGGCIAINADQSEERRRWSAAHELAHFLTDRHRPVITFFSAGRTMPARERFADAFARCFLLPATGLQRRFERIRRSKDGPIRAADVLALSRLYQVSFQAMAWRLEDLKLLPNGASDGLNKPVDARELFHRSQHESEIPRLPARYETLAIQAFDAEHLTEGQLADRLMTDRIGARDRILALTTQEQSTDDGRWHSFQLDLAIPLVGTG